MLFLKHKQFQRQDESLSSSRCQYLCNIICLHCFEKNTCFLLQFTFRTRCGVFSLFAFFRF